MFQKSSSKKDEYTSNVNYDNNDNVETVVGPSVNVEGDFSSEGNIVVKGTVSGSVNTSKLLTVEDGAKIFANVKAGNAHISGSVKGNVKVVDRLDLSSTAQILGDIVCKVLTVESGALIQGKVSMKGLEIEEKQTKKTSSLKSKVKDLVEDNDEGETV
ncbi:MAG TPA: polymer-forming cytoskeletal protein [Candidatus Magasanikbacteria bacterium]|jgi:cytoskeletal protein CcmA (bactofilin family)|nr:polymer-forming cytoskeletal protein [Candidatus Magasanikbacteria bacterium]HQF57424.1 polymer-forming cytoskeletal protein [Candidatus Magasanikbacteria bacterium]HQL53049.1 polymer-forming cytoskeletal protein [Candidatus Magasanikbacteria bacterium]